MTEANNHIIAKCRWNTSFNKKERAAELQERISNWSGINLQKEICEVFDSVCPPGQTWKIQSLELDLGTVDFNNMEFELATQLRKQLNEKLVELVIQAGRSGHKNMEILNEDAAHVTIIGSFLRLGVMPWSYQPADGSLNQILAYQLQHNRHEVVAMLRETGLTHENVRKRMAWQMTEPNILKIIECLEPNNHTQIIEFSNELAKIQARETIIQTSSADFKKNLWFWVLNHLYTERGTIFNKVAFMKSNIRQMASHYNIGYEALFELIERAVEVVNRNSNVKADFLLTLRVLSKEKDFSDNSLPAITAVNEESWVLLDRLFRNTSMRKTVTEKNVFNELIIQLSRENSSRLGKMIFSLDNSGQLWLQAVNDLTEASLESVFGVLHPAKSAMLSESIYFLVRVTKEMQWAISPKALWKTGIRFLHQYKNVSFNQEAFFSYCIARLGEKNRHFKTQLLEKHTGMQISFAARNNHHPEIYTDFTAALFSDLTQKDPVFFVRHFTALADLLMQKKEQGPGKAGAISLQESLLTCIRLDPAKALDVLLKHPGKEKLHKLLLLLDEPSVVLLITQSSAEKAMLFTTLRNIFRQQGANETMGVKAKWMDEHFTAFALQAVVFHPSFNVSQWLEWIFNECFKLLPASAEQQFVAFMARLSEHPKVHAAGISELLTRVLGENRQEKKVAPMERASRLMQSGINKQAEVALLLSIHYKDPVFKQARINANSQAGLLLNYLLNGGKSLMEILVRSYSSVLGKELKTISQQELTGRLQELFWKCVLDYKSHYGNRDVLRKSFMTAVLCAFPIAAQQKNVSNWQEKKTSSAGKTFRMQNGNSLSMEELRSLLEQCLEKASETAMIAGVSYTLTELLPSLLETDPAAVRNVLAAMPFSEQRISVLKGAMSFGKFSTWVSSGTQGALYEAILAINELYQMVSEWESGTVANELGTAYWKYIWKCTRINAPESEFKKLVSDSLFKLMKAGITGEWMIAEIKKNKNRLTPKLKVVLLDCLPALSTVVNDEKPSAAKEQVYELERKGMLETFCDELLGRQQLPPWWEGGATVNTEELLGEIMVQYPIKFLQVLKHENITTAQIQWLCRSISFETLTNAITGIERERRSLLNILAGFYKVLGTITIRGMAASDLQGLLFSKVIKAWTSGNWKMVSAENIWNEMRWDVCTRRGISSKDFTAEMVKAKLQFPLALQVSLGYLAAKEEVLAASKEKAVFTQLKQLSPVKTATPGVNKSSIAVRNAGVVLINSYIPMLLERLQLISNKKFISRSAQAEAVHYLQYVVTGLSATEEELLPLNKVLCGLPLSEPIPEGIEIQDAHKTLVDGLIKAMIGHWSSVGDTSVNGFRGNWLVRNGLLAELEDKWELTVEKRAYDLLIDKSPYSFSVIKYPWMHKPIHVNWKY